MHKDISAKFEEIINGLNSLKEEVKNNKKEVILAINDSQEDTIESLSALIHEGYALHEERIICIENHLDLPPLKQ